MESEGEQCARERVSSLSNGINDINIEDTVIYTELKYIQ